MKTTKRRLTTTPEPNHEKTGLDDVRKAGVFGIKCALWLAVILAGGLIFASLLAISHYAIEYSDTIRKAAGFRAPEADADWFLLFVAALFPMILLASCVAAWRWYSRIWNRRLAEVWAHVPEKNPQLMRWQPASSEEARLDYLRQLLRSEKWKNTDAASVASCGAPTIAEAVRKQLEQETAKRALTTGFIVGLSRNRWLDGLTIVVASFELQLYVLTRLGKRPSIRTWAILIENCAASLFVNTYLNREEALWLNLLIKKIGIGIQAAGELTESAVQSMAFESSPNDGEVSPDDIDMDEGFELLQGDVCSAIKTAAMFSAGAFGTVGSVGLQQLGRAVDTIGDELLQGVIAAAVLQHQGMRLASKTIGHQTSVSFFETAKGMAEHAGLILRKALRARREALRKKRSEAVKQAIPTLRKEAQKPIESFSGVIEETPFVGKPLSKALGWLAKKIGGQMRETSRLRTMD